MGIEIKIIEGYDLSSYFCFRPVILKETGELLWDEEVKLEEEFSIEEEDISCFLAYFFYKYFDENLTYNKRRFDSGVGFIKNFEWHLTHNFYTYDTLRKMLDEIIEAASLLETDYDNPKLDDIKKNFSIIYMCSQDDADYINHDNMAIKNHISVVVDFYRRFAKRLTAMMDNNQNTTVISLMGP